MNIWGVYQERIDAAGGSKRGASKKREIRHLSRMMEDSLSYKDVVINGEDQPLMIIDTDNLNEKKIQSLPGRTFKGGDLIFWNENYWLVTEKDADAELYTKGNIEQCNHLLKWVDDNDVIHEQWCIVKDGTKYLTGEYEDRNFVVTRGDSRISLMIARNKDTVKFKRGCRFLIDDPDSEDKRAYLLTKPLKIGRVFNSEGVYSFVLQEVVATENDNHELGIADYYQHFPIPEHQTGDGGYGAGGDIIEENNGGWI